jgi:hypothetical protein
LYIRGTGGWIARARISVGTGVRGIDEGILHLDDQQKVANGNLLGRPRGRA